jgi:integrase/recombinase XerC
MLDTFLQPYAAHLTEIGRRASTVRQYVETLRRADVQLPRGVLKATTEEIRRWLRGRDPATHQVYRAALRSFYRFACNPPDAGPMLSHDPTEYLPPAPAVRRRRPRPCTTAELADILERAGAPFRLWFALAGYGGLRCCEISTLDREHVTHESMWVQGKGGHERIVPTDADLWPMLRTLPDGPVAVDRRGERIDRARVSRYANRHLHAELGYDRITMHRLRHWYGTNVYRVSGDILVTQELLGHRTPVPTAGYAAVGGERLTAAVAGLPRLLSS